MVRRVQRRRLTAKVCLVIHDFLVIGGGIAGASAAYELAAQGSVLVLEAESAAGYHSTGRSAALFTRNYGGAAVRRVNIASEPFFRSPPDGFCDTPLLTPRGLLSVASPEHAPSLDQLLDMSEPGHEITQISPEKACDMVPFLRPGRVARAVYEADVSDIDVATLHLAYLKGAKARRAMVMTRQSVTELTRGERHWQVRTATDCFHAAVVVNAAGAWADRIGALAGAQGIGLVPKRRTGIIIDAPQGIDTSSLPAIDFAGSDAYLKPEAGKLMASPGDATPTDPHDAWPDDMDIAVLADWIERETRIEVRRIGHSWAGLRSFVADGLPVVGFDPHLPGFFWLAGQGGYGIMMAPALAILTARLCVSAPPFGEGLAEAMSPMRLIGDRSGRIAG